MDSKLTSAYWAL